MSRLLKQLQWTAQMPIRRAIQRHEPAIKRWRAEDWPELKAGMASAPGAGFRGRIGVLPRAGVGKAVQLKGQTPVIHEKQTHDHLSVMGGMTPEGKVYTLVLVS